MKKHYKILSAIVLAEFIVIYIMSQNNIKIQSFIGSALGVFAFFLPIQILLFLLSKDTDASKRKRVFAKVVFWFICFCYLSALIAGVWIELT